MVSSTFHLLLNDFMSQDEGAHMPPINISLFVVRTALIFVLMVGLKSSIGAASIASTFDAVEFQRLLLFEQVAGYMEKQTRVGH